MTYRRPGWQTLTLAAAIALLASSLLAFSRPVEMRVDGARVESDVPPVTTSDKVYVPLRSLAEALGAETEIHGTAIDVIRGDQSLQIKVGDTHARVNGQPFTLKSPPFRVRGRVMISLKPVAQAFDVRIEYNARTARIDVLTPGIGEATTAPQPEAQ
jgi:hypothetical protein